MCVQLLRLIYNLFTLHHHHLHLTAPPPCHCHRQRCRHRLTVACRSRWSSKRKESTVASCSPLVVLVCCTPLFFLAAFFAVFFPSFCHCCVLLFFVSVLIWFCFAKNFSLILFHFASWLWKHGAATCTVSRAGSPPLMLEWTFKSLVRTAWLLCLAFSVHHFADVTFDVVEVSWCLLPSPPCSDLFFLCACINSICPWSIVKPEIKIDEGNTLPQWAKAKLWFNAKYNCQWFFSPGNMHNCFLPVFKGVLLTEPCLTPIKRIFHHRPFIL